MKTVTAELRKSIKKTCPKFEFGKVFSDTRAQNSVGVKIVNPDWGSPVHRGVKKMLSSADCARIQRDMEKKGFVQRYGGRNRGGVHEYWGTRFCYYKPGFTGPEVQPNYSEQRRLWELTREDYDNPALTKTIHYIVDGEEWTRQEWNMEAFNQPGPWDKLGKRNTVEPD